MSNYTILLNITCVLGSIQFNIGQYSLCFINITQYYTHFNILLHIGEYWFQYYLILPEQLSDEMGGL